MAQFKNGIVMLDGCLNIQYIDDLAKDILELDDQCKAKSIKEVISNEELTTFLEEEINSGSAVSREFKFIQAKRNRDIHIKAESYNEGEISGYLLLVTDLTDIRRLEGLQREFVANVSHELRTPLTSIKMAAESLQLGAIADERMRNKFLSNIQREADRLTRLVNELLVIANLDNKVTLHISRFDPVELLSDVVTVMNYHAELNDITLVSDFPDKLPMLEADKDRIQQVLINLTDNAIKCNRQNGKVTVYARAENDILEIKVMDTGIGIHKVDLDRIFDRFFRVDKSRSRVTGGTGLGLSIVKDLIVAHGGQISVESTVDVGTTFIIKLPFKSPVKS